jgi:hypothetical protein
MKRGKWVGRMFYDSCKILSTSTFPSEFPFLELIKSYGCFEILGLNYK